MYVWRVGVIDENHRADFAKRKLARFLGRLKARAHLHRAWRLLAAAASGRRRMSLLALHVYHQCSEASIMAASEADVRNINLHLLRHRRRRFSTLQYCFIMLNKINQNQ